MEDSTGHSYPELPIGEEVFVGWGDCWEDCNSLCVERFEDGFNYTAQVSKRTNFTFGSQCILTTFGGTGLSSLSCVEEHLRKNAQTLGEPCAAAIPALWEGLVKKLIKKEFVV